MSGALTAAQSRQLIEAYAVTVERVAGDGRRAAELVMPGTSSAATYPWLGKYEQRGRFVGNGDSFRRFGPRLTQYAPHRLPTQVLNRLCTAEGALAARGSKGTRSKYKKRTADAQRYVPEKRLQRSDEDEARMLVPWRGGARRHRRRRRRRRVGHRGRLSRAGGDGGRWAAASSHNGAVLRAPAASAASERHAESGGRGPPSS